MSSRSPLHVPHRGGALADLALAGLAGVMLALAPGTALGLPPSFVVTVGAVYAVVALGILQGLPVAAFTRGGGIAHGPGDAPAARDSGGLGTANRITLTRVVLSLPLAGLALWPTPLDGAARWWIVGLGTVALVLDGVDGRVARRTRTESPFGARFDMESDAALLMVLCVLTWRSGQAGPWVFGIGAMRYLFVAAAVPWPALAGELPPSLRRKVVCVVQGIALLVAIAPVIPPVLGAVVCALALAMLTWSFAVDTVWLLRRRPALH